MPDTKQSTEKRKREKKNDSKLEILLKQTCTSLDIINQKQHIGIFVKHEVSDFLN